MSITKDRGNIVFECDCCSETLDTEEKDFEDAMRTAKDNGFKAICIYGEWKHICSKECEEDLDKEFDV